MKDFTQCSGSFLAAAAAPLQVARNAMQRGLVGDAGPWGATLVRFLFGLAVLNSAIFAVMWTHHAGRQPRPRRSRFWIAAIVGAISPGGGDRRAC